jgi:threonyl-tRNA synthetase
MHRVLYADCNIELHDFEDPRGKQAFWHSSAHILGEAIENTYGSHLCIGPPLSNGFYYDTYMGTEKITPENYVELDNSIKKVTKESQPF